MLACSPKTSTQSSQHRRGRESRARPRQRHRSESRRLCTKRGSGKAAPGTIHVFCRSANAWMEGRIVEFLDEGLVRVEYGTEESWFGKTLHWHSNHLDIPEVLEEADPGLCFQVQEQKKIEFEDPPVPAKLKEYLADATQVTDDMKRMQRDEPTLCAMSLKQWNIFVDCCKAEPLWQDIKRECGFVSVRNLNDAFVKPWTRGTGCGVALLMNRGLDRDAPGKEAEIMLSHSWAEDAEECQAALKLAVEEGKIMETSAVWFCTFAQYQAEDNAGPTISQQLEGKPFQKVIKSGHVTKMLAIHTTQSDLYDRLWCVHEVDKAIEKEKDTVAAFSPKYAEYIEGKYREVIDLGGEDDDAMDRAGITVNSGKATCSRKDDTKMLLEEILSKTGGFKRIDKVVSDFRRSQVSEFIQKALQTSAKAIISYTKKAPLEGVEMLFNIAAHGATPMEKKQQNDLFAMKLQPWVKNEMPHFRYHFELKACATSNVDLSRVNRFVFQLLRMMAKSGHAEAIGIMLESSNFKQMSDSLANEQERNERNREQVAYDTLQILAQDGYQQAVDELASRLALDDYCEKQEAKRAFKNLVANWNPLAIKTLHGLPNDHKESSWKNGLLKEYVRRPLETQWC